MSVKSLIIGLERFTTRVQASVARRFGRVVTGGRCYCICCRKNSPFFLPYFGGARAAPPVMQKLDLVGSDLERYSCPKCESNDRERHLKLYFQRLNIDRLITGSRVLHFAPERCFGAYVFNAAPAEYIKADLFPSAPDVQKVDMLEMKFDSESFDMVIANHVLEHVADDARALSEIHRVLRRGGVAILQTPYSSMLHSTFEDAGLASPLAREHAYGQDDHVRLYGQDIFSRFADAGFMPRIARHEDVLVDIDSDVYGVNPKEPFFLFERI
jgi:SAM-dependent methyltransferase